MDYCEHCEGQRFDRARTIRALRRIRRQLRDEGRQECEDAMTLALSAVRGLDIPHLEFFDPDDEIIH
jgi:hypothetical protein